MPLSKAHVLIAARSEIDVKVDAKSLRRIGFTNITFAHSGNKALSILKNENSPEALSTGTAKPITEDADIKYDLILCDENVKDGNLLTLYKTLKSFPFLKEIPFLALTSRQATTESLMAENIPALARPYAINQLEDAIISTAEYFKGAIQAVHKKNQDIEDTRANVKKHTPAELIRTATALISQQRTDDAEKLFVHVLQIDNNNIEACLGLCRIFLATKNTNKLNRYLLKGCVICLRRGEREKAGFFLDRLPERLQSGNFFKIEADFLLRSKEYIEAATTFVDACEGDEDNLLVKMLVQSCKAQPEPSEAMREMSIALAQAGEVPFARRLFLEIDKL